MAEAQEEVSTAAQTHVSGKSSLHEHKHTRQ